VGTRAKARAAADRGAAKAAASAASLAVVGSALVPLVLALVFGAPLGFAAGWAALSVAAAFGVRAGPVGLGAALALQLGGAVWGLTQGPLVLALAAAVAAAALSRALYFHRRGVASERLADTPDPPLGDELWFACASCSAKTPVNARGGFQGDAALCGACASSASSSTATRAEAAQTLAALEETERRLTEWRARLSQAEAKLRGIQGGGRGARGLLSVAGAAARAAGPGLDKIDAEERVSRLEREREAAIVRLLAQLEHLGQTLPLARELGTSLDRILREETLPAAVGDWASAARPRLGARA